MTESAIANAGIRHSAASGFATPFGLDSDADDDSAAHPAAGRDSARPDEAKVGTEARRDWLHDPAGGDRIAEGGAQAADNQRVVRGAGSQGYGNPRERQEEQFERASIAL